ncbi:hypothetical protein ACG7TL_000046 [Trametes sanguinea]
MTNIADAKLIHRVALRGEAILTSPRWNKGTAFTIDERKAFALTGRLPFRVNTLDEQCDRAYDQLEARKEPLRKNTFLQSLKDQNWVLYYALISRHLKELTPIIYTPTEAEAISNYSHLFRRSEGLYLTFPTADAMEEDFLGQTKGRQIDLIVCSDAEQILGIGDQGVGGIGISAAKSVIYTLLAGVNPANSLSVTLDVGTDNEDLLRDRLYVGWPHKRVRGQEYDDFVDRFVQLVRKHYPHSLLHFEDFGVTNAKRLLDKYRDKHAVFNDDVQGTGAVTLACIMSAVGVTKSKLADQRFIVFGAGSAGLGIARQIRDGMVTIDGMDKDEANKRFYLLDRFGLIKESLGAEKIREGVQEFVRLDAEWEGVPANDQGEIGLLDVVKKVKPTVLIGCSTKAGAFTEEVVREMAKGCERPIILPLSNPNALIYPGLGFGAMLSKARELTDTMIIAGTRRLASLAPALKNPDDALLPDFEEAPEVNYEVAVAVVEQAIEEGGAGVDWKKEEVREKVREAQWKPLYGTYVYDPKGQT